MLPSFLVFVLASFVPICSVVEHGKGVGLSTHASAPPLPHRAACLLQISADVVASLIAEVAADERVRCILVANACAVGLLWRLSLADQASLVRNAVLRVGVDEASLSRDVVIRHTHVFSCKTKPEGKATSQSVRQMEFVLVLVLRGHSSMCL